MPEGQSEGGAVGAMKAQLGDRDRLLDLQIKSSQSVSQTNRSAGQPASVIQSQFQFCGSDLFRLRTDGV